MRNHDGGKRVTNKHGVSFIYTRRFKDRSKTKWGTKGIGS